MGSAQVSWWDVHLWVADALADIDGWPAAGTPAWCDLDDTDPRKIAAVLHAGEHWALRVETCQQAMAETSRDISGAADWSAIATEAFYRHTAYIRREIA
jgi:hypothetical protein